MPYTAPVSEFTFLMEHVVGLPRVAGTERFAEATPDMVSAILTEAGRLADEVLAPLNRGGDLHPAHLENGVVRTSPGFADGYRAIAEGGYIGMSADPDYGGLGLPMVLTTAVNEMIGSACLSLQLNPLMTQGQIEALEHHASDDLKALYLPRLTTFRSFALPGLPSASGMYFGTRNRLMPLVPGAPSGSRASTRWQTFSVKSLSPQEI